MNLNTVYRDLDGSPDAAVSVILKLRGETCDIDCLYCYEKRKETPDSDPIKPALIRQLVDTFRGRQISLELHGGEPLTIGRQNMHDLLMEIAAHESIVRVSMQTNGVLLDDAWIDIFEKTCPKLQIGISVDGDETGNAWRVDYLGNSTYKRTAAALKALGAREHKVGIIVTVTQLVLGRAREILENLASFDAVNSISLVPCFDHHVSSPTASLGAHLPKSRVMQARHVSVSGAPSWSITPSQYANFVLEAALFWTHFGLHERIKLEPIVSTIRRLKGLSTGFCHFSDLKCNHIFTVYPDGRFGSCDELAWPSAQFGQLSLFRAETDVIAAQHTSSPLVSGRKLMHKCLDCDYQKVCGGGCLATRLRQATPDQEESYCDYRMRLVDGVAALLAAPASATGVHCRRARWRPRTPNTMPDVGRFIKNWNDPTAGRDEARLRRSRFGNINTTGEGGVQDADDLDPMNPAWSDAIEIGVKPLVQTLTKHLGCITYDSCEGHDYGSHRTYRRVGILPRDGVEYAAAADALCRAISEIAPKTCEHVTVSIGRSELACGTTGRRFPVLDLHVEPATGVSDISYSMYVDDVTSLLAQALSRQLLDADRGCSCTSKLTCQ